MFIAKKTNFTLLLHEINVCSKASFTFVMRLMFRLLCVFVLSHITLCSVKYTQYSMRGNDVVIIAIYLSKRNSVRFLSVGIPSFLRSL